MSDLMNIHTELSRIQSSLKCPKGRFNHFGKYTHRSCEDVLEALKPHLKKCSVTLEDEIISVGDRVYVKATASLLLGSSEISTSAYAREPTQKKDADESQITGAASSYARKRALSGLFAIDDGEDADQSQQSGKQDGVDLIAQINELAQKDESTGKRLKVWLEKKQYKTLSDCSESDLQYIHRQLEAA